MRITSVTLRNFRCFGPEEQILNLGNVTALVGSNGCGKSSALMSLVRLFGTTQAERSITRADFFRPPGKDWEDIKEASLRIEAKLEFPELANPNDVPNDAAAGCFKHMTVLGPAMPPYCRIRLDAKWQQTNLPEGDVEMALSWVLSPFGTKESDEKTQGVQPFERSCIHVHYVPAMRDPGRQIRQVSGSLLHTLLRAVQWSDGAKTAIETSSNSIRDTFVSEEGVKVIQAAIDGCWKELHATPEHRDVAIRPVAKRLEDLMRQVEAVFSPGPSEEEDNIDQLSDGQRSLFYIALVSAMFDIHETVSAGKATAISRDELNPPILNVLAVEEPENHVAPHYLGRIMETLRRISQSDHGQIVLSSHSAAILARVNPEEVRHLRMRMPDRATAIRSVVLPSDKSEQYKFIREAVRAYPELYFAQFVVLGEGDSEEIVLPRLAEAKGIPVDASFVSIVPLGGRHVNHLWRLLNQLEIPYVTLLDLDRERDGGGWGRVKYALEQLLACGFDRKVLLAITQDGHDSVLADTDLALMHTWDNTDTETMKGWLTRLEVCGVFFSEPLDLDFMMLTAFPAAYKATAEGMPGPRIPDDTAKYKTAAEEAVKAVLKQAGGEGKTYTEQQIREFFWYRYLFLGRSKPSTHILAMSQIKDADLLKNAPKILLLLLERMETALTASESENVDAC